MTIRLKQKASTETLHQVRHISYNPQTGQLVVYFKTGKTRETTYYGIIEVD